MCAIASIGSTPSVFLRALVSSRQVARSLLDMGCYSVSLGDTIGAGTAGSTLTLIESLKAAGVPLDRTAMHFHDTYGQALANILVALEEVRFRFGSSLRCRYDAPKTRLVARVTAILPVPG